VAALFRAAALGPAAGGLLGGHGPAAPRRLAGLAAARLGGPATAATAATTTATAATTTAALPATPAATPAAAAPAAAAAAAVRIVVVVFPLSRKVERDRLARELSELGLLAARALLLRAAGASAAAARAHELLDGPVAAAAAFACGARRLAAFVAVVVVARRWVERAGGAVVDGARGPRDRGEDIVEVDRGDRRGLDLGARAEDVLCLGDLPRGEPALAAVAALAAKLAARVVAAAAGLAARLGRGPAARVEVRAREAQEDVPLCRVAGLLRAPEGLDPLRDLVLALLARGALGLLLLALQLVGGNLAPLILALPETRQVLPGRFLGGTTGIGNPSERVCVCICVCLMSMGVKKSMGVKRSRHAQSVPKTTRQQSQREKKRKKKRPPHVFGSRLRNIRQPPPPQSSTSVGTSQPIAKRNSYPSKS
jgi:hypothetical protein